MNHLHAEGFYGHQERRGGTDIAEPPVVWFPHGEIGNSPSEPVLAIDGPHRGQMYVGAHYQGTVFMHSQGLEAWRYELREAYGGPKVDAHPVRVTLAGSSPDGRQVRLNLDPRREGEVLSMRPFNIQDCTGRSP